MLDVFRTLPLVVSIYLEKLLVPVGLTGYYYTPYVTAEFLKQIVAPSILLLAVGAGVWWWYRREKDAVIAFAGFWLLAGLAPALYLRNFGNGDFVRDRYMYLPSVGFAILAAMGLRRLPAIRRWNARAVQGCAVVALCLFYVSASVSQQVYWASDLLVSMRGESLYPGNPNALVRLSAEYGTRGANEKAIELAQEAVRLHPEYYYGFQALAEAHVRAGHFEEGRKWLNQFLAAYPQFADSLTGKASLAALYGQMGDFDRAIGLCGQVLAKEANLYSALYNCGNIHLRAGSYSEAERLLAHAVQLEPLDAAPKHFLGRALFQQGRNQEALPYLRQAAAMDPKVWDYHYWLGQSLERSGDLREARAQYQVTLLLNPDSTEAKMRSAAMEGK
jgi:tetratricopeptide (TPR) repeat protein